MSSDAVARLELDTLLIKICRIRSESEQLSRVVDRVVCVGGAVVGVEEVGAPREAFEDAVGGRLGGQVAGVQDVRFVDAQIAELVVHRSDRFGVGQGVAGAAGCPFQGWCAGSGEG